MTRIISVVGFLSLFLITSCGNHSKKLSKAEFPESWPFKVESGTVRCLDGFVIVFETNGKTYALNDAARLSDKYENVLEIIRPDANYPGGRIMKDLSDIEFEGLKLCDR